MAVPHTKGPSGSNRAWLGLIGLILIVAGVAGLGLSTGLVGQVLPQLQLAAPGDPVVPEGGVDPSQAPQWAWLIVIAGGVIIALLGLAWLIRQFPKISPSKPLRLQSEPGTGTTSVQTSAVEDVITEEIEAIGDVLSANVKVQGTSAEPLITVNATVSERADLPAVISQIRGLPVQTLAQVLGGRVADLRIFLSASSGRSSGKVDHQWSQLTN